MRKKVIFACSSGIATSTVVAGKTKEYCEKHGIEVISQQSTVGEISGLDESADLFVVTSDIGRELKTPVVNGLPLITGVGEQEILDKIVSILRGQ